MKLEDFLPTDARRCIQALTIYGHSDVLDFITQNRRLKMSIVDSLEMYSGFPVGTKKDMVFRSVMNCLDQVLSVLDNEVGELFPHYSHPITDDNLIGKRIKNIDARLNRRYGELGFSHRIGGGHDLAKRVEQYTRYKNIDKTLYQSPGALQIIYETLGSLEAMGIK